MTRSRRALLYVPGDDRRKIEKAAGLNVDSVCLDLEDGVALNRKSEARATVAAALSALSFGRSERLVRLNPIGSGLEADDLAAALAAAPDALVIPKVESAEQLQWVSSRLPTGSPLRLLAMIETARGLVNLNTIAAADLRLDALIFGAEDYAASVGATRTPEGREVLYARSAVVAYAAALGLQAIDMVFVDFRDGEGLAREAAEGAQLGYSGKQAIHPDQIGPIHAAFTPGDDEIARARRIVEADAAHQAEGTGAFALDGKMVDMPIVRAARLVLAKAQAAGKP